MSDDAETLSALLAYAQAEGRVCPQPQHWIALYDLLPGKKQLPNGGWEPAAPLILAAWHHSPYLLKMLRLREHIEYAAENGALEVVNTFLRNLPADGWYCGSRK